MRGCLGAEVGCRLEVFVSCGSGRTPRQHGPPQSVWENNTQQASGPAGYNFPIDTISRRSVIAFPGNGCVAPIAAWLRGLTKLCRHPDR